MKKIDDYIERCLFLGGFKTKKNLAKYLGIDPSAINQWINSGNIPSRHLIKIDKAIEENINKHGNFIKNIKKNEGNINQGGVMLNQTSPDKDEKDPRAQVLLERYEKLSEKGKIEAENCVNNIYLKELRSKNVD